MSTQTKTVGLGLLGCGVIGQKHAAAADDTDGATLAAVTDLDHERAKELAQQHGQPTVHDDAAAMFADPAVDVVILAMPVKGRAEMAAKAFDAGKHVLVEKPAAMNAEQLQQMINARDAGSAKHSRTLLGAGCSCRHSLLPSARAAAEVVNSGRLGAIRVVRILANKAPGGPPQQTPPVWRVRYDLNAGGIMSNWGVYDLDYMLSVCGWDLEPTTVLGQVFEVGEPFQSYVHPQSNAETHAVALIRCRDGSVITIDRGEFVPLQTPMLWQIVGEYASLRCVLVPGDGPRITLDEADAEHGTHTEVIHQAQENWQSVHANPLRDISEAVTQNRSPASTFERLMDVQRITDAIYASSETGQAVRIG